MSNDIAGIIQLIFTILSFAIIGRALLSWFDPGMRSSVGRVLFDITEPIIAPIRRFIPSFGMFDISPIVALLLLQVVSRLLVSAASG